VVAPAKSGSCKPPEVIKVQTWQVDPLVKVFPDSRPDVQPALTCEVAKGETATWQIALRCDLPAEALDADVSAFALRGGDAHLAGARVRFVGYVPVDRGLPAPPADRLRVPPCLYPDPLLEAAPDIEAGTTYAVWISLPVSMDAKAGEYVASLTLSGQCNGRAVSGKHELRLRVYDVAVGKSRLWVTNWFWNNSRHMQISAEVDTPQYWALLARYALNMAEHRQNVAIVPVLALTDFRPKEGGGWSMDFSRFNRWVHTFVRAGVIGRIEGGHIGGREGDWESQFLAQVPTVVDGAVRMANLPADSPEADAFYAQFFPALLENLQANGWLDIYMQHLADEPIASNIGSYRALAALVRKYAPGVPIVEACHTKDLVGSVDVWVPQLNYLHQDFEHYQQRQAEGEEVWHYTCIYPMGEYANRFIEHPLIKTRLLHWINYRYGITGYLHWGYNHWGEANPYEHLTGPFDSHGYLPAGDAWIVYPGKDGPVDSIRWETMRDGIADYELLCMLAERDPEAANRLAGRHILAFDRYEIDVTVFRQTRRELLERLSR
jgi:hypothetical protein